MGIDHVCLYSSFMWFDTLSRPPSPYSQRCRAVISALRVITHLFHRLPLRYVGMEPCEQSGISDCYSNTLQIPPEINTGLLAFYVVVRYQHAVSHIAEVRFREIKTYCSSRIFEHSHYALQVTLCTSSRFVVFYDYNKLALSCLISTFLVYC